MFGLSFWELGMILIVALVVLGPKQLPKLAKSLGSGLRALRRASADLRGALAEPLKEVQEPLDEMRSEFYQTVSHFGQELEKAADDQEEQPVPAKPDVEPATEKLVGEDAHAGLSGETSKPGSQADGEAVAPTPEENPFDARRVEAKPPGVVPSAESTDEPTSAPERESNG